MLGLFVNTSQNGRQSTNGKPDCSFYEPRTAQDFGLQELAHVVVVSDLHICEGQLPESAYWQRLENFTFDAEFAEFLQHKQGPQGAAYAEGNDSELAQAEQAPAREQLLVINGDFIDFLRITRTPKDEGELAEWRLWLEDLPAEEPQRARALAHFDKFEKHWRKYVLHPQWWHWILSLFLRTRAALRREKRFGLGTEDFKSVYRLEIALQGHRAVFAALAQWLKNGSALAFVTGNHDPELDQQLVQSWLRCKLEKLAGVRAGTFAERVQFFPRGVDLCGEIRVEHGHRYEWHTRTNDRWLADETQSVALPSGSFFNRYFINKIETVVPYLDNVRPVTRVIAYLLRHHTLEALSMLGQGIQAVLMLLFKPSAWGFLGFGALSLINTLITGANFLGWGVLLVLALLKVWQFNMAFLLPALVLMVFAVWAWNWLAGKIIERLLRLRGIARTTTLLFNTLVVVLLPTLDLTRAAGIYVQNWQWDWLFLLRPMLEITLLSWGLRLLRSELRPHFDHTQVREKMTAGNGVLRFAVCGHTHIPDQQKWEAENVTYLNSGTWTLVFEYESDIVRYDLTKTFVEFVREGKDKWQAGLWRWEPPQAKEHKLVLMKPRKPKPAEQEAARRKHPAAHEVKSAHEKMIIARARRKRIEVKAD